MPKEAILDLPIDELTERFILGAVIQKSEYLQEIRHLVDTEDFGITKHRGVWEFICKLYDAGEPVDLLMISTAIIAAGKQHTVATPSEVADLQDGVPLVPKLERWVDRLKATSLRRKMVRHAHQMSLVCGETARPVEEMVESFSGAAADFAIVSRKTTKLVSIREIIRERGADFLLGPRRSSASIKLPWEQLNGSLDGMTPGQLLVLLAATSRGKTSFGLQVASSAAVQGFPVLIWTMEMSAESLSKRLACQLSGIRPALQSTFQEREAQRDALAKLNESEIWFDSTSRTVGAFAASVRRLRPKMVVIDYLQLIKSGARTENRTREVSDNSRQLKLLAMDVRIPVLALSQVDRSSVKGTGAEIGLHSAKESGDIENDADVVMWIKAGELSRDAPTDVKIHIGKQREGPAGFDIPMVFDPQSQTFSETR